MSTPPQSVAHAFAYITELGELLTDRQDKAAVRVAEEADEKRTRDFGTFRMLGAYSCLEIRRHGANRCCVVFRGFR